MRPRCFRIDVIGRDRRHPAPVVDARIEQLQAGRSVSPRRLGVALAPVVVNAVYADRSFVEPDGQAGALGAALGRAAAFRTERCELQHRQLERLAAALPLPQLRLPFVFTAALDAADIEDLATCVLDAIRAAS